MRKGNGWHRGVLERAPLGMSHLLWEHTPPFPHLWEGSPYSACRDPANSAPPGGGVLQSCGNGGVRERFCELRGGLDATGSCVLRKLSKCVEYSYSK